MKKRQLSTLIENAVLPDRAVANMFTGSTSGVYVDLVAKRVVGYVVGTEAAFMLKFDFPGGPESEAEVLNIRDYDDFTAVGAEKKKQSISAIEGMAPEVLDFILPDYDMLATVTPPFGQEELSTADIASVIRYSEDEKVRNIHRLMEEKASGLVSLIQKIKTEKEPPRTAKAYTAPKTAASSEMDYQSYALLRAKSIEEQMEKRWRGIKYDKENPLQVTLAENFYGGKNQLLLGETGIGKTYNPENIAKRNGIACEMIQFETKTDAAVLQGVNVLKQGIFDREPTMHFRYGSLSRAFIEARERAKEFEPTMLILDELLRAEDMSSLIASLSVVEATNEYNLVLFNEVEYVLLDVEGQKGWFAVTDTIDQRSNWFTVSEGGALAGTPHKGVFLTERKNDIAQMHSRGDLPTIRKDQVRRLKDGAVLGYEQRPESIRVPQRALAIIATSNIGENYEVLMGMDNALFRRLAKVPMISPEAEFMVKRTFDLATGFKDEAAKAKTQEIVLKYAANLQRALGRDGIFVNTTARVNFSTIADIVCALDKENPLKLNDDFGGIYKILKAKSLDFVDLEPDMSASDLLENNIVGAIENMVDDIRRSVEMNDTAAAMGVRRGR